MMLRDGNKSHVSAIDRDGDVIPKHKTLAGANSQWIAIPVIAGSKSIFNQALDLQALEGDKVPPATRIAIGMLRRDGKICRRHAIVVTDNKRLTVADR